MACRAQGVRHRHPAASQGRHPRHRTLRLHSHWSEFLFALVLTSGDVTVTLQVANYVSASSGKLYGVQAAMGTVSTLPVIFFGYLIQRHLVRGLTFGAVKR